MSKTDFSRRWLYRDSFQCSIDSTPTYTKNEKKKSSSPQPLSASSQSPLSGSQHEFHMASTSGTRLAQEIHDEFLCCKICLEAYKNPKSLNCLHTFCEQCIENHVMSESTYKKYSDYRDFTCPLCRKRTQLPIGGVKKLPDNFLVSSLTEMVGRQKPSKYPFCDICKMVNRKHREATSKCLDCNKLLCSTCLELHKETKVTAGHSIFDVEIEKDIECKEHQDEVVRFYCEPCEACICVLCTFNEHRDHEITQFGEAVVKYKENIQKLLGTCTAKLDKYDSQLDSLNECEETIKTAEQRIHDVAIEFIQEIRTREKQLVEELRNIYGRETMEYIDHKKDVAAQVESLRSTCTLTDVILKGKDIELLLLKKDVQEKLTTLNEIEVKNLPRTISKVVKFLPGSTDLGVLQDLDRPGLSTMRAKRPCEDDGRADGRGCPVNLVEKQTQTDESALRKKTVSECTEETEDSEDESSSEDSSDEDNEGPDVEEKAVQTERVNRAVSETKDESTLTDEVETEDKGVNTRSRSLQALSSVHGATIADDGSLAARRRRRRERAQTSYIGPGSQYNDSGRSYEAGDEPSKYRRSRFVSNNSLDSDDSYYDTAPHSATNHL